MEWTYTVKSQLEKERHKGYNLANNLDIPHQRASAVVLNLPGAQAEVEKVKAETDQGIHLINAAVAQVKAAGEAAINESKTLQMNVARADQETKSANKTVSEAQVLASIRKEQADALKEKYGANYHSSWLGLWRPLSEQSRVALFVAALAFGLTAVFSFLYYFWTPVAGGGFIQTTSTNMNRLFGGAAAVWRKKRN